MSSLSFPQHKVLKYDRLHSEQSRDPSSVLLCFIWCFSPIVAKALVTHTKPRVVIDQVLLQMSSDLWQRVLTINPTIPAWVLGYKESGHAVERLNPSEIMEALIDSANLQKTSSLLCHFPTIQIGGEKIPVCIGYAFNDPQPCFIVNRAGNPALAPETVDRFNEFTNKLRSDFRQFVSVVVEIPGRDAVTKFLGELPFIEGSGEQVRLPPDLPFRILAMRTTDNKKSTVLFGGNLLPAQFSAISRLAHKNGYHTYSQLVGDDDWKRRFMETFVAAEKASAVDAIQKGEFRGDPRSSRKWWQIWK